MSREEMLELLESTRNILGETDELTVAACLARDYIESLEEIIRDTGFAEDSFARVSGRR